MAVRLDELDRKILGVLQEDASRSLDDIAKSVGSSKTPVWNRIKKMRESGVIGQHTVILDADALGLEACFFVLIRTSAHEAGCGSEAVWCMRTAAGNGAEKKNTGRLCALMRTHGIIELRRREIVRASLLAQHAAGSGG